MKKPHVENILFVKKPHVDNPQDPIVGKPQALGAARTDILAGCWWLIHQESPRSPLRGTQQEPPIRRSEDEQAPLVQLLPGLVTVLAHVCQDGSCLVLLPDSQPWDPVRDANPAGCDTTHGPTGDLAVPRRFPPVGAGGARPPRTGVPRS